MQLWTVFDKHSIASIMQELRALPFRTSAHIRSLVTHAAHIYRVPAVSTKQGCVLERGGTKGSETRAVFAESEWGLCTQLHRPTGRVRAPDERNGLHVRLVPTKTDSRRQ